MTGTLNALRISVTFQDFPGLNLMASDLAAAGVHFTTETPPVSFDVDGIAQVPTHVDATLSVSVIKCLPVAEALKIQLETDNRLGMVIYRVDTMTLTPFFLTDCVLARIGTETSNGVESAIEFVITGRYPINRQGR